jgi:hypothetical protein
MLTNIVAVSALQTTKDDRRGSGASAEVASFFLTNGMDAPAFNGISCAKVEVSSNHLNQQERPG